METKSVTIAIPFYNAEKYLNLAIESVINQTFKNWNLILIDDGSNDTSLSIATRYAESDGRIRVISDGLNKNLGGRLNEIPYMTDSEFLVRMDADDIMHPYKIQRQIDTFIKFPDIDVLGTNAYAIDKDNFVIGIRFAQSKGELLRKVNSFIHPTIMAKTEWFKANPYDVKAERVEDLELWCRTFESYNFQMLTEPLFFYREFQGGYYKKYFFAQKSKNYLKQKYPNNKFWNKYFKNNYFKYLLYKFFNFFKQEGHLINRRNSILFKHKKLYVEYIR